MASTLSNWNRLNQFLDGALGDVLQRTGSEVLTPRANVLETESGFELSLELPGMEQDQFQVTYDDGALTVSGERRFEDKVEGQKWHRVERRYGKFERSFALPRDVDATGIEARYVNGVLTVRVPKSASSLPRKIEVK